MSTKKTKYNLTLAGDGGIQTRRRTPASGGSLRCFSVLEIVLFLSWCISASLADITVVETGHRYKSKQEADLPCKHLWRGYEYVARLQQIEANPFLCPLNAVDDRTLYNVTVPKEGIPVALLVRGGGGCTLEEKVQFALNRITPQGVVRYLIVGDGRRGDRDLQQQQQDDMEDIDSIDIQRLNEYEQENQRLLRASNMFHAQSSLHKSSNLHQSLFDSNNNGGDDDIPLYILHVSLSTEVSLLLDVLRRQSPDTQRLGGPRITLDSRGGAFADESAALWISLSALISACACSFLLIVNGNRWAEAIEENHHHAPARPSRRRLTREQIKKLLPRYLYDAEARSLRMILDDQDEHHRAEQTEPLLLPQPLEMDVCSICLDDYETGDKIRCLPCNHTFHAKCIGKWLHERSATCPLCKIDLWIEEEEAEPEQPPAPVPSSTLAMTTTTQPPTEVAWWDRFHPLVMANRGEVRATEEFVEDSNNRSGSGDFPRPSWWRRMFPSVSRTAPDANVGVEVTAASSLTEPLLSQQSPLHTAAELASEEERLAAAEAGQAGESLAAVSNESSSQQQPPQPIAYHTGRQVTV